MNWTHLPHRSLVAIHGPDRRTFLDGLLSQNLGKLDDTPLIYGLFLSPQGRFLHDLFIFEKDNTLYLDVEKARANDLLMRLQLYKLRSQVTFEDLSDKTSILWHPDPSTTLEDALTAGPDPRTPSMGARAFRLGNSSLIEDLGAYHRRRIALCIPEGSWDMPIGKAIPLECNLELCNAIDFLKGCYLGQELTTRTKHRGLVRKHLYPLLYSGPLLPFGTALWQGDEEVGDVRFSVHANPDADEAWMALGMLYDTAVESGAPLTTGDHRTIQLYPYQK